jgi:hypothetical protein
MWIDQGKVSDNVAMAARDQAFGYFDQMFFQRHAKAPARFAGPFDSYSRNRKAAKIKALKIRLGWEATRRKLMQHPLRNSCQLTEPSQG